MKLCYFERTGIALRDTNVEFALCSYQSIGAVRYISWLTWKVNLIDTRWRFAHHKLSIPVLDVLT